MPSQHPENLSTGATGHPRSDHSNHAFAVVVPARNAAAHLPQCLSAITQQLTDRGELIVVDDGSTDATARVAAQYGARVISLAGVGPAAARNAGSAATTASIVVFFDSDCVPLAGCINELLKPFDEPAVSAARGAYDTRQASRVARFVQLELDEKQERLSRTRHATFVDTACAAFLRSPFLAYGGFDEGFSQPSAEDVDISFRMHAGGEALAYAPAARVLHHHPETLWGYFSRKFRFGVNRARVYRRYPSRLHGDGYTPRLMPLQIVLAPSAFGAVVASLLVPPLGPVAAVTAAAFLVTTLPLSARAWKTDRGIALIVPPMLVLRSVAQAAGLLAGLARLAIGRAASNSGKVRPANAGD